MVENLATKPLLKDAGLLLVGVAMVALSKLGSWGRLIGMGQVVGTIIAFVGLRNAFMILFVEAAWMDEARRLTSFGMLRALWCIGAGGIVAVLAWRVGWL